MKRRKFSRNGRHELAVRDGLAWWTWSCNGPMWIYRCSKCRLLIRRNRLTVGHIVPLSHGGTYEDSNLRAECYRCNLADNVSRSLGEVPDLEIRLKRVLNRDKRRRLAKLGKRFIFWNIPVSWEGRIVSYTSKGRARHLILKGRAAQEPEGGIRLLEPPRTQVPSRRTPIPNECVRCGIAVGLQGFSIYPPGHPFKIRFHPTDARRPVCADCMDAFEIGYAVEMTRKAGTTLFRLWRKRQERNRTKAAALEALGRRKSGRELPDRLMGNFVDLFGVGPSNLKDEDLQSLADQTEIDLKTADEEVRETVHWICLQLDYPSLFASICAGDYDPSPLDRPGLPAIVAASL